MSHRQEELDEMAGCSFTPRINRASQRLSRSVTNLLSWKEQTDQKKEKLRDLSEQNEKEKRQQASQSFTTKKSQEIL